jgi:hypothetical protein
MSQWKFETVEALWIAHNVNFYPILASCTSRAVSICAKRLAKSSPANPSYRAGSYIPQQNPNANRLVPLYPTLGQAPRTKLLFLRWQSYCAEGCNPQR